MAKSILLHLSETVWRVRHMAMTETCSVRINSQQVMHRGCSHECSCGVCAAWQMGTFYVNTEKTYECTVSDSERCGLGAGHRRRDLQHQPGWRWPERRQPARQDQRAEPAQARGKSPLRDARYGGRAAVQAGRCAQQGRPDLRFRLSH